MSSEFVIWRSKVRLLLIGTNQIFDSFSEYACALTEKKNTSNTSPIYSPGLNHNIMFFFCSNILSSIFKSYQYAGCFSHLIALSNRKVFLGSAPVGTVMYAFSPGLTRNITRACTISQLLLTKQLFHSRFSVGFAWYDYINHFISSKLKWKTKTNVLKNVI